MEPVFSAAEVSTTVSPRTGSSPKQTTTEGHRTGETSKGSDFTRTKPLSSLSSPTVLSSPELRTEAPGLTFYLSDNEFDKKATVPDSFPPCFSHLFFGY